MNDSSRPLAFLDVETTGTRPGKHELLEVGVVIVSPQAPLNITDSFAVKIKPMRLADADQEALVINRFNEEEWKDAKLEADAVREFSERVRGAALWGWNVGFDRAFLEPAMNRAGISLEDYNIDYTWYDLKMEFIRWAKIAGRVQEFAPRFSLGAARRAFGIETDETHRALPDALATYRLFLRLEDEFARWTDQLLRNQQLSL